MEHQFVQQLFYYLYDIRRYAPSHPLGHTSVVERLADVVSRTEFAAQLRSVWEWDVRRAARRRAVGVCSRQLALAATEALLDNNEPDIAFDV